MHARHFTLFPQCGLVQSPSRITSFLVAHTAATIGRLPKSPSGTAYTELPDHGSANPQRGNQGGATKVQHLDQLFAENPSTSFRKILS